MSLILLNLVPPLVSSGVHRASLSEPERHKVGRRKRVAALGHRVLDETAPVGACECKVWLLFTPSSKNSPRLAAHV